MKLAVLALACCLPVAAQQEQQDLEQALSEAGASPTAYLRALERHLAKYPESALIDS